MKLNIFVGMIEHPDGREFFAETSLDELQNRFFEYVRQRCEWNDESQINDSDWRERQVEEYFDEMSTDSGWETYDWGIKTIEIQEVEA